MIGRILLAKKKMKCNFFNTLSIYDKVFFLNCNMFCVLVIILYIIRNSGSYQVFVSNNIAIL